MTRVVPTLRRPEEINELSQARRGLAAARVVDLQWRAFGPPVWQDYFEHARIGLHLYAALEAVNESHAANCRISGSVGLVCAQGVP